MADGAVFLDRDGVINEDRWPTPLTAEQVVYIRGSLEAVARLSSHGWRVFIVTNKSAMGWRLLSAKMNDRINAKILDDLTHAGATVEKLYYCGHNPIRFCDCRKPKPGMLLAAQREFGVDPAGSWMIGDKLTDVEAGRRFGAKTILLASEPTNGPPRPDRVAPDLSRAVDAILAATSRPRPR